MSLRSRRGLPLLLAGLALFAYLALSPRVPHDRTVTYRYPATGHAARFEVRWTEAGSTEMVHASRFSTEASQRQCSHELLLADGDYTVEAELPSGAQKSRHVHVDTNAFVVVFE